MPSINLMKDLNTSDPLVGNNGALGQRVPTPAEVKAQAEKDRPAVQKKMADYAFEHVKHEVDKIIKDEPTAPKKPNRLPSAPMQKAVGAEGMYKASPQKVAGGDSAAKVLVDEDYYDVMARASSTRTDFCNATAGAISGALQTGTGVANICATGDGWKVTVLPQDSMRLGTDRDYEAEFAAAQWLWTRHGLAKLFDVQWVAPSDSHYKTLSKCVWAALTSEQPEVEMAVFLKDHRIRRTSWLNPLHRTQYHNRNTFYLLVEAATQMVLGRSLLTAAERGEG